MPSVSARKHTVPGLLRLVREYGGATPVDAARSAELLTRIRAYAKALENGASSEQTLTLQEVWNAARGNPEITPSKEDVLAALRMLAEVCDATDSAASPERPGTPIRFGCHCDLEPGMEPDGCVLDYGRPEDCVHSHSGKVKQRERCEHWKPITITGATAGTAPAPKQDTQ